MKKRYYANLGYLSLALLPLMACIPSNRELSNQPLPKSPYIYVLGVAQDAGYPQAGCYVAHCQSGWNRPSSRKMPTALAVVDPINKQKWLFEATPAFSQQWYDLEQVAADENYDFEGVFITHAHIGHYTGLMYFGREAMGAKQVPVYAMPRLQSFLENNGPWNQLVEYDNIALRTLQDGRAVKFKGIDVTPFLVPHRDEYSETVGYEINGPNKTALFIPDINKWSIWNKRLEKIITSVDYALIDATFYDASELPERDMSQIPHPFVVESMALLDQLPERQRNKIWFIHMNHSNPLLNGASAASQQVTDKGYNIAYKKLKLAL